MIAALGGLGAAVLLACGVLLARPRTLLGGLLLAIAGALLVLPVLAHFPFSLLALLILCATCLWAAGSRQLTQLLAGFSAAGIATSVGIGAGHRWVCRIMAPGIPSDFSSLAIAPCAWAIHPYFVGSCIVAGILACGVRFGIDKRVKGL